MIGGKIPGSGRKKVGNRKEGKGVKMAKSNRELKTKRKKERKKENISGR